jgi:hypothetical protein
MRANMRFPILCVLLVGSLAVAGGKKDAIKADPIVGRVVDLEILPADTIVTVHLGTYNSLAKDWRARFREGTSEKLLEGGDATIIRMDHRTTILKVHLTPAQVRANRLVQFDAP